MGVDVSDVFAGAAAMDAHALSIPERAARLTEEFAELAKSRIAANAPRGEGDDGTSFADSFQVETGTRMGKPFAEVGTNQPEGFRLEMGFQGSDSVGRRYSQTPNPTVGPVADGLAESFWAANEELIEEG